MNISGDRIRATRRARNLTGGEVARRLGISAQYYYNIENGRRKLSAELAAGLAQLFGVSADYLLGLSDDPSEPASPVRRIPAWATGRDVVDFKKMLLEDVPVMFDGVPLDDDDRERVLRVMEAIFWDAKRKHRRRSEGTDEEGN